MTPAAPSSSIAHRPRVALTGARGTYRVESQATPGTFYTTTAVGCSCPARKPCKHMRYVKGLNRAFYVKKVAPVAGLDAVLAESERRLTSALRALADAHPQADEYAVLLRHVDQAERQVAALSSSAMRAA